MIRRTRANPKFEKDDETRLGFESGKMVGTDCDDAKARRHSRAKTTAIRGDTAAYSAVPLVRHPIHHPVALADHEPAHAAYVGPSPRGAGCDPRAEGPTLEDRGPTARSAGSEASSAWPSATLEPVNLTSDNLHLSEVTQSGSVRRGPQMFCEINCKFGDNPFPVFELTTEGADLLRHSLAANSARAYRSDVGHFQRWGGTIPAAAATICRYVADHSGKLTVATIQRRIATLSKAHEAAGVENPCRSEIVKTILRGLKRKHGTAQRQAKPLLRDDLLLVLESLGTTLRDQRDSALLLLGFAGGFRRSELVAL